MLQIPAQLSTGGVFPQTAMSNHLGGGRGRKRKFDDIASELTEFEKSFGIGSQVLPQKRLKTAAAARENQQEAEIIDLTSEVEESRAILANHQPQPQVFTAKQ